VNSKPLEKQFQPLLTVVGLDCPQQLISEAGDELHEKASKDDYKCFGYFPGMQAKAATLDFDLPKSKVFADKVSTITFDDKKFLFSFLRMSLIQQKGISPYHVDSDASAALTGDIAKISDTYIWRFLINLSDTHHRTLSYLDIDPQTVELQNKSGYVHYAGEIPEELIRFVNIPPRNGSKVSGVVFCASRVLHAGRDDEYGHFVAGYGCEITK